MITIHSNYSTTFTNTQNLIISQVSHWWTKTSRIWMGSKKWLFRMFCNIPESLIICMWNIKQDSKFINYFYSINSKWRKSSVFISALPCRKSICFIPSHSNMSHTKLIQQINIVKLIPDSRKPFNSKHNSKFFILFIQTFFHHFKIRWLFYYFYQIPCIMQFFSHCP